MIISDQPTIFGDNLRAFISSVDDGPMKFIDRSDDTVRANITTFLSANDIEVASTVYQRVQYKRTDFTRYTVARRPSVILQRTNADGIATDRPGLAIFLPLADCTGAIIYDPAHRAVMISHLGRHSTEQFGARRSVEYICNTYGSDPRDLRVWLSPSPGAWVYPLFKRDNRGLLELNHDDFVNAGVLAEHIESSSIDTARSHNYYSHSEFLKGHRSEDGRFAIVAQLL